MLAFSELNYCAFRLLHFYLFSLKPDNFCVFSLPEGKGKREREENDRYDIPHLLICYGYIILRYLLWNNLCLSFLISCNQL